MRFIVEGSLLHLISNNRAMNVHIKNCVLFVGTERGNSMREYYYKKIDAFTSGKSVGNPAACLYLEEKQILTATGSGNSAFGYYLLKKGMWGGDAIRIEQGGSIGTYLISGIE